MTTTTTVIAANRFGLGARPNELRKIGERHRAWLLDQLEGPDKTAGALRALPTSRELIIRIGELRAERRAERKKNPENPDREVIKRYSATLRSAYLDHLRARYAAAAQSSHPFHERLVHFWSNHFAVSADKKPLAALAGGFENEAIRPHVAGRFRDLLRAAVKHPAMLIYLDNLQSMGPASRAGQRRQKKQVAGGLNENLAREILELHTLGVGGGYAQADVTAFARAITGWSVGRANKKRERPGEFMFRAAAHEPGSQSVLGNTYAQNDVTQGEAILDDLATHPATARHVARKLARHFVADEPPAALVERLAQVFMKSGGDLSLVYTALVESDEPWHQITAKYKSPHDFLLSTMRAFDYTPDQPRNIFRSLEALGQPAFQPGSPAGWPDTAEKWGGADALYKRIEWAAAAARLIGTRVNPLDVGEKALGVAFSARTRRAVSRAQSLQQGTTLLLSSPDFQRR
ncbi:MAG: DUF1800 family protein [Gammaproteobacteria bacterium]